VRRTRYRHNAPRSQAADCLHSEPASRDRALTRPPGGRPPILAAPARSALSPQRHVSLETPWFCCYRRTKPTMFRLYQKGMRSSSGSAIGRSAHPFVVKWLTHQSRGCKLTWPTLSWPGGAALHATSGARAQQNCTRPAAASAGRCSPTSRHSTRSNCSTPGRACGFRRSTAANRHGVGCSGRAHQPSIPVTSGTPIATAASHHAPLPHPTSTRYCGQASASKIAGNARRAAASVAS
jgi:hypothetical protein